MKQHGPRYEDYTVGWVCSLPVELAAAQMMLDEEFADLPHDTDDPNIYTLGRICGHNVVLACLPLGQMETESVATCVHQMKSKFRSLQFCLMVGIGGGVPSAKVDIRLGDVVVSRPDTNNRGIVQYDNGRVSSNAINFWSSPPTFLLNALTKTEANYFRRKSKLSLYLSSLNAFPEFSRDNTGPDKLFEPNYNHNGGDTCEMCNPDRLVKRPPRGSPEPVIHYGTIASGRRVIKDGVLRDTLSSELGGVLCFDIGAAGLMEDCPCLLIRGICDYADSHGNKKWCAYAAATATAYTKDLLSVIPTMEPNTVNSTLITMQSPGGKTQNSVKSKGDVENQTLRHAGHKDIQSSIVGTNPSSQMQSSEQYLDRKTNYTTAFSGRPPRPELESWERYKDLIHNLYIIEKRSLTDVSHFMSTTYGFNASKHQYERMFKRWGFQKYINQAVWQFVGKQISTRKREGKDSAVYINGSLIPAKKVRKELARTNRPTQAFLSSASRSPSPDRILVTTPPSPSRSPSPALSSTQIDNLPWFKYQESVKYMAILHSSSISEIPIDDMPEFIPPLITSDWSSSPDISQQGQSMLMRFMFNDPPLDPTKKTELLYFYLQAVMVEKYPGELLSAAQKIFSSFHYEVLLAFVHIVLYLASNRLINDQQTYEAVKWAWSTGGQSLLIHVFSITAQTVQAFAEHLFHGALCREDMEIVQLAIKGGVNLDSPLPQSRMLPLHFVVKNGNVALAKLLLHAGANPNACLSFEGIAPVAETTVEKEAPREVTSKARSNRHTHEDETSMTSPLEKFSQEKFVRPLTLAEQNTRFSAVEYPDGTALLLAAESGNLELVEDLLAAGAYINAPAALHSGRTALQAATETGHLEIVRLLIERGADVNAPAAPHSGRTALQAATETGHLEIVRLLIERGADVNAPAAPHSGRTALQAATETGHLEIVRLLIERGADVNAPAAPHSGRTALQAAIKTGHLEIVRLLIERGADVNAPAAPHSGRTALQAAIKTGNLDLIRFLVEVGADVNGAPAFNSGRTALQAATETGHLKIVQLLIENGADINAPAASHSGRTALQAAAETGNLEIVRLLIEHGADVNGPAAPHSGRTALQAAAETGNLNLTQFLLQTGADVNCPASYSGKTALEAAAEAANFQLVRALLDAGADLAGSVAPSSERNMLQIIANNGLLGIAHLLLNFGMPHKVDSFVECWEHAMEGATKRGRIDMVQLLYNIQPGK